MQRKHQRKRLQHSTRKNNHYSIQKRHTHGTQRHTPTQRQSIAHCHHMLHTSSKNYASIGRKIRSFVPHNMRLSTSNTVLGKQTTQLLHTLQKYVTQHNQTGGGGKKQILAQVKRHKYITLLDYV